MKTSSLILKVLGMTGVALAVLLKILAFQFVRTTDGAPDPHELARRMHWGAIPLYLGAGCFLCGLILGIVARFTEGRQQRGVPVGRSRDWRRW